MITIIIVDDEELARERLKQLIGKLKDDEIEILDEAKDGMEAVEKIERWKPDCILLDVEMPGMNGLDVIRHLNYLPMVIFSTAYDRYAIKAFEIKAIDYLLKPYSKERLEKAIARVKDTVYHTKDHDDRYDKKTFLEMARLFNGSKSGFIPTRMGEKIKLLPTKEIIWFDSEHSVTSAHISDKIYTVNYTLDELEEKLISFQFVRVHRSTLVNLNFVDALIPWFSGAYKVVMKNKEKTELTVSWYKAKALKDILV